MAAAAIVLDFDPVLWLGDLPVLWETLALAAVIVVSCALAGSIAGRLAARDPAGGRGSARSDRAQRLRRASAAAAPRLDREVLLYLLLGAVPGAFIGGRIGYVIAHFDYYVGRRNEALDPGRGSLELTLAVVGGVCTAALVAQMFRAPIGRWLHVAALPVMIGIGLGKFAMALDADGQGAGSDLPWATAYLGPGPWASLAPQVPSHPAQIYEGVVALTVAAALALALRRRAFRRQDGTLFLAAVALWALGRAAVATTWRDEAVLGAFSAAQLLALGVGVTAGALWFVAERRAAAPTGSLGDLPPAPAGAAVAASQPTIGLGGPPDS